MGDYLALMDSVDEVIKLFVKFGNKTPLKFVYCNRAEMGKRSPFRPYDLVLTNKKNANPEYFTISTTGVTHVKPHQPTETMTLSRWLHETCMFNIISELKTFKL